MKSYKRGAVLVFLVLFALFCTVCTVAGDDAGSSNVSNVTDPGVEQYRTFDPGAGGNVLTGNTSFIRELLLSLVQSDRPSFATPENTSAIAPSPAQTPVWNQNETPAWNQTATPDRNPNETGMGREVGPVATLGTASAYIVFLFTFGLSTLLLFALSRAGRALSENYVLCRRRAVAPGLAAGYLILGAVITFVSIPLLSWFSASLIGAETPYFAGAISFCVVYLLLSSLVLAYSVYVRKPFVLVMAVQSVLAVLLVPVVLIVDLQTGMIGTRTDMAALFTFTALVPLVHWRLMQAAPVHEPSLPSSGSSSAPTMISGGVSSTVRTGNGFPPELDDRYMGAEEVGRGGMALVFRAKRREDGAVVAVKVPTRYDETTGHCFMKEMQIWKGLVHPNIVKVYAYNILPVPYVEMEYVGPSLAETKKPVSPDEAVRIVRGVAAGLAYAHAQGMIHRDIKPGNILLAADGTPKITDWGLGKEMTDRQETRFVAFSLDYAAPEQISPGTYGRGDTRTDVFQLGAVFYELLTGHLPFAGDGVGEVSVAILTVEPSVPSAIAGTPASLDAVVMKCLEKNPERRYRSIGEMLADLDAATGHPAADHRV